MAIEEFNNGGRRGSILIPEELANILNCSISSLSLKYLGLPLGASFKSKAIWDGVRKWKED
jgi:predicted phosphoribosyltransferase